jgi:hypothetical protein
MARRDGRSAAPTKAGGGGGGETRHRARSRPGGATAAGRSRREGGDDAGGRGVGVRRGLPGQGRCRMARSRSRKGWGCRESVRVGRGEATVADGRGTRKSGEARSGTRQSRHCRAHVKLGGGSAPVAGGRETLPVIRRWGCRRACPGASAGGQCGPVAGGRSGRGAGRTALRAGERWRGRSQGGCRLSRRLGGVGGNVLDRVHRGCDERSDQRRASMRDARVTLSNALCLVALRAPGFDGKVSQRFVGL